MRYPALYSTHNNLISTGKSYAIGKQIRLIDFTDNRKSLVPVCHKTGGKVMRILITGATGKLGSKLVEVLSKSYDVVGMGSSELDIKNFNEVLTTFRTEKPDMVVNAAAWTDVDGCALDPDKAVTINGFGAQNLAIVANEMGASILQVSSNEVFDGTSRQPYREYDHRNPSNAYGYSKYVGERAIVEVNPRHYIVRASWIFAHKGKNFIHAIIDAARNKKPLRVVIDEVANPTYNDDLADAIGLLIDTGRYGTYHLPNEGTVSRYQFARYVLDKAGFAETSIEKISLHEWQRPSRPPVYSGLDNTLGRHIGIRMRNWQDAVDEFLQKEGLIAVS
jgi:dTDP-4-dehydrorhamnose reductase